MTVRIDGYSTGIEACSEGKYENNAVSLHTAGISIALTGFPMTLDWQLVPPRFHYLRPAVEICHDAMLARFDPILNRHVMFDERATPEQLACLAAVHEELRRMDQLADLQAWCVEAFDRSDVERDAANATHVILAVIERLGQREVAPFCDAPIVTQDLTPEPTEDTLPEPLRYLIGPALHFGERYRCEAQMILFFEEASPVECEHLAALAERIRLAGDWPRIWDWTRQANWRSTRFAWEISSLLNLMDLCDFQFWED